MFGSPRIPFEFLADMLWPFYFSNGPERRDEDPFMDIEFFIEGDCSINFCDLVIEEWAVCGCRQIMVK